MAVCERTVSVSIVIPCLNAEATIEAAIASVECQSDIDMEIICVNDGSEDSTHRLLSTFASRGVIDYIDLGVSRGASVARNRGLSAARAECVQFLDADDTLLAGKLRRQVDIMRKCDADFVAGAYAFNNLAGYRSLRYPDKDCWGGLIASGLGRTSSNLFRRESVQRVGGWAPGQKSSQEYELMFRLLKNGGQIACDDIIGTQINALSSSISNGDLEGNAIRFMQLRKKIVDFLALTNQLTDYRTEQYNKVCQNSTALPDSLKTLDNRKEKAGDEYHQFY